MKLLLAGPEPYMQLNAWPCGPNMELDYQLRIGWLRHAAARLAQTSGLNRYPEEFQQHRTHVERELWISDLMRCRV